MVLLTSSAVSTIVSGGVICIFTFLLFLSGYVLQQQTVRSLQDALRHPPEKVTLPIPVLPPQFQPHPDDQAKINGVQGNPGMLSDISALPLTRQEEDERTLRNLWHKYLNGQKTTDIMIGEVNLEERLLDSEKSIHGASEQIVSKERLAYIFTLPDTKHLCSAVLFVKRHRDITQLSPHPSVVFIYPAIWDISDKDDHLAAMDLLREMQDNLDVTLHPVTISRVWAGISVQQQLLAELQRYRWSYHRAMYLGSLGVAVNTSKLDAALALSNTKSSWTLLHPDPKSYEASNPTFLLWAAGRGLLYPRQEMKSLVARASIFTGKGNRKQKSVQTRSPNAAYVLLDEKLIDERDLDISGFIERYEDDRREVCSSGGIIE